MELVGQTVGVYHIRKRLGEGGIGIVYLAWDSVLGREAAIKILRPEYAQDARLIRNIIQDARTAARLSHPNIVTIYSVGSHDGRPYFAMEYLQGEWLRQRIDRARTNPGQHMAPQEAARVAREVAKALDHAHQNRVAHLDVKPENVVLIPDGRVVLTDFGIARHFGDAQRTHHGGLVGTILYMAPEQFDSKVGRIGPATDLYALGAVLYEMLTSRPPFRAQNIFAIMRMHLQAERPKVSKAEPRLGTRFDSVVERAMAIRPRSRYNRAWDFSRDVAAAADVTDVGPRPQRTWRGFVRDRLFIRVAAVAIGLATVLLVAALPRLIPAVPPRVTPSLPQAGEPTMNADDADVGDTRSSTAATGAVIGGVDAGATDTPAPSPTNRPEAVPRPVGQGATESASRIGVRLTLHTQFLTNGCVQLKWEPTTAQDLVVACRGAGCSPVQGIFTGEGMYPWNPKTVFPDALPGDTIRWSVKREGVLASVDEFRWEGGDCGRPKPTSVPPPLLPNDFERGG